MITSVVLAWATTGQVCDENGLRLVGDSVETNSNSSATADETRDFCDTVLSRLPFLECHISGGVEPTMLHSECFAGPSFSIAPSASYRVRLFEWVSQAPVSEVGAYLSADDKEPTLFFDSYREAQQYCRAIMRSVPKVEPWIYGTDGVVMQRGGSEVVMHESGEYTVPLSWWRTINRKQPHSNIVNRSGESPELEVNVNRRHSVTRPFAVYDYLCCYNCYRLHSLARLKDDAYDSTPE